MIALRETSFRVQLDDPGIVRVLGACDAHGMVPTSVPLDDAKVRARV